jgi:hypothetical protein
MTGRLFIVVPDAVRGGSQAGGEVTLREVRAHRHSFRRRSALALARTRYQRRTCLRIDSDQRRTGFGRFYRFTQHDRDRLALVKNLIRLQRQIDHGCRRLDLAESRHVCAG